MAVSNCGVFVIQNEVLALLLNNKWFDTSKESIRLPSETKLVGVAMDVLMRFVAVIGRNLK